MFILIASSSKGGDIMGTRLIRCQERMMLFSSTARLRSTSWLVRCILCPRPILQVDSWRRTVRWHDDGEEIHLTGELQGGDAPKSLSRRSGQVLDLPDAETQGQRRSWINLYFQEHGSNIRMLQPDARSVAHTPAGLKPERPLV